MDGEPVDEAAFDAWLSGDPRRKAVFDAMWRRMMGSNMDLALDAYSRKRPSPRALVTGALAVALVMFGGYKAVPSVELFFTQPQEFAAADKTISNVTLDDGSRLTLAGGADVRVRYTRHERVVELTRGTLFADVAHDSSRPFRIEAGGARITDLGTRFEVSKKLSDVRVSVEEGVVRFGPNGWFGKSIDLAANQAAALTDSGLSRLDDPDAGNIARWRSEWVEYQDAPMRQVVADLAGAASLPIEIASESLAERRVTGRIQLTDPDNQLGYLSVIHGFKIGRSDGRILLSE
ncbi:FecR family protein [Sphingopyxis sp. 113P3]|uniref:FecR family protein n=1 Tax=Sphingopyxis sp. (strain 113P3) TaxID=292913 RepID=UPI0006AD4991|nr:FecR domain-containing protein [Sphingopyxis sp. 113P3]